jgi:preprotein translocase subunit SecG
MVAFLAVLTVLASIVLILVVLVQNSKGGGLSSAFSQQNSIMGVKKTTDFIEKLTWGLAIGIVVFCLVSAKIEIGKSEGGAGTATLELPEQSASPLSAPDVNSPQPAPVAPAQ